MNILSDIQILTSSNLNSFLRIYLFMKLFIYEQKLNVRLIK